MCCNFQKVLNPDSDQMGGEGADGERKGRVKECYKGPVDKDTREGLNVGGDVGRAGRVMGEGRRGTTVTEQ